MDSIFCCTDTENNLGPMCIIYQGEICSSNVGRNGRLMYFYEACNRTCVKNSHIYSVQNANGMYSCRGRGPSNIGE